MRFAPNPFHIYDPGKRVRGAVGDYLGKSWGVELEPSTATTQSQPLHPMTSHRRFFTLFFGITVLLGVFLFRLTDLQIVRGATLRTAAEENRIRIKPIPAARGVVYDRHGQQLVRNIPNLSLQIVPADLPKGESLHKAAIALGRYLGEAPEALEAELAQKRAYSYDASTFREHLSYETALRLRLIEHTLPGIHVEESATREYLLGLPFSHLLGYTGKINENDYNDLKTSGYLITDQIGKTGLERSYEEILRGKNGKKQIEVDSLGKEKRIVASETPVLGKNLYLSINAGLQAKIQEALERVVDRLHTPGAAAVAVDPRNGEILALASVPSFDNNIFSNGTVSDTYEQLLRDERNPFFNRAIAGQFPPGSTIKPFIASAALQENLISETTTVNSTGGIRIGQWFFPDWKAGGHGITDVRKAIADSVNSFFYTIGGGMETTKGLGVERITQYLRRFGFGETTNVDLSNETSGFLPSPQWKIDAKKERWYIGDTYHLSIGQGDLLVTPLQMAVATATIANGGTLYRPRLVTTIEDSISHEKTATSPERIASGFISQKNIRIVQEGMRQTVLAGSGKAAQSLPIAIAGKTGTAQYGPQKRTHGWFTAFAPYDNPEIALVVVVEGGGEGTSSALPAANEILGWYFSQH